LKIYGYSIRSMVKWRHHHGRQGTPPNVARICNAIGVIGHLRDARWLWRVLRHLQLHLAAHRRPGVGAARRGAVAVVFQHPHRLIIPPDHSAAAAISRRPTPMNSTITAAPTHNAPDSMKAS